MMLLRLLVHEDEFERAIDVTNEILQPVDIANTLSTEYAEAMSILAFCLFMLRHDAALSFAAHMQARAISIETHAYGDFEPLLVPSLLRYARILELQDLFDEVCMPCMTYHCIVMWCYYAGDVDVAPHFACHRHASSRRLPSLNCTAH